MLAYVTASKLKAKDCEFGSLSDDLVRDILICGVRSDAMRGRLLREAETLTLKKAVDICRAAELAERQVKSLSNTGQELGADALEKMRSRKNSKAKNDKKQEDIKTGRCGKCGRMHKSKECPAYGSLLSENESL